MLNRVGIMRSLLCVGILTAGLVDATGDRETVDGQEQPDPEKAVPSLADTGATDSYLFQRDATNAGVFWVSPTDTDNWSFPVTENFLSLVNADGPVDDDTRLRLLVQYPLLMNKTYEASMGRNYPDASVEYDTPFEPLYLPGVTILADPLAGPYVRISIHEPGLPSEEFSLNRAVVERLLAQDDMDEATLIDALRSFSYRLPESVRSQFDYFTQEEIFQAAEEEVPRIAQQEFVRVRNWYKDGGMAYSSTNNPSPRAHTANAAAWSATHEPTPPQGPLAARQPGGLNRLQPDLPAVDAAAPSADARDAEKPSGGGVLAVLVSLVLFGGIGFLMFRRYKMAAAHE